jgi:hypothetical protein
VSALLLFAAAVLAVSDIEVPPTVWRFYQSDAFVRVLHGPVGSSKSSNCVLELGRRASLQRAHEGLRDTRFAVIRNTYRELEDTTRATFDQWLGDAGEWREADFAFDIEGEADDGTTVKSEILFRALDKPKDVKKLLSLELTGAYINELREVPKLILDGLTSRLGRWPRKLDGGASWYGMWGDTNPWAESSEYAELFANPPNGFELFRQPSGLSPEAENIENLPDGYYERMCAGKSQDWIDEYVHGKNPKADKGSVYGEQIADLKRAGRICSFDHPLDGVNATFDLGLSDATAIWFWRIGPDGLPDILDWYEATGKSAEHFIAVLKGQMPDGVDRPRKYQLSRIWLPHDARQRTFQTGVSTFDRFLADPQLGRITEIVPELSIASGIDAGRWLLEQKPRIHSRCADGVKMLGAYRFKFDDEKLVFSKTPIHNFASHTADAWRYVACVVQPSALEAKRRRDKEAEQARAANQLVRPVRALPPQHLRRILGPPPRKDS